ncbi:hypothetical protein AVEN_256401-1 [Araneus ventricosus]|uniref:Uncharacterized protein n=1 Tax=Araneus ventricosus TaxID=182803 RepID=A0A4Y2G1C7_ARAVE|nr:hypothetical protein AVEN_256401-1 [Araneus ventricosus]
MFNLLDHPKFKASLSNFIPKQDDPKFLAKLLLEIFGNFVRLGVQPLDIGLSKSSLTMPYEKFEATVRVPWRISNAIYRLAFPALRICMIQVHLWAFCPTQKFVDTLAKHSI